MKYYPFKISFDSDIIVNIFDQNIGYIIDISSNQYWSNVYSIRIIDPSMEGFIAWYDKATNTLETLDKCYVKNYVGLCRLLKNL